MFLRFETKTSLRGRLETNMNEIKVVFVFDTIDVLSVAYLRLRSDSDYC